MSEIQAESKPDNVGPLTAIEAASDWNSVMENGSSFSSSCENIVIPVTETKANISITAKNIRLGTKTVISREITSPDMKFDSYLHLTYQDYTDIVDIDNADELWFITDVQQKFILEMTNKPTVSGPIKGYIKFSSTEVPNELIVPFTINI
jgi:hypothetical protein